MLMYNLLEYSYNYYMTSGSLCSYYRDEVNYFDNETADDNNMVNNKKTTTSESFEYKTKMMGSPNI